MNVAGNEVSLHTAIAVVTFLAVVAVLLAAPRFSPFGADQQPEVTENRSYLLNGSDPVLGNTSADVAVIYWGDYQCPLCARFERGTFQQLKDEFIQPGTISFIKKDFPNVGGRVSDLAAYVGECVRKQEGETTFWEWHEGMYQRDTFNEISDARGDAESLLIEVTDRLIETDTVAISGCLGNETIQQRVSTDIGLAEGEGIYGTPGFVIYNRQTGQASTIYGSRDIETFRETISQVQ